MPRNSPQTAPPKIKLEISQDAWDFGFWNSTTLSIHAGANLGLWDFTSMAGTSQDVQEDPSQNL